MLTQTTEEKRKGSKNFEKNEPLCTTVHTQRDFDCFGRSIVGGSRRGLLTVIFPGASGDQEKCRHRAMRIRSFCG